jgi:propionyl-CoA synthetase
VGRLAEMHRRSLEQAEDFWAEAAAAIDWVEPWQRVLDDSQAPFYRWFTGGRLNTCHNALDRHVEGGRAEQPALVYDSPVTDTVRTLTYRELRDAVAAFAGALAAQGVERGDRVVIYMPMVPEAAIAMLACARIGAVHSVVFGGFAANELASRIEDAKPRVVVCASCGIEPGRVVAYKPLLDAAIELSAFKPQACIVLQRPLLEAELVSGRDLDWNDAVATAEPAACVAVEATDPLYILYTSGTTGRPKGIVRDNGGHAVALVWSMKHVYDVDAGEVYWAASDVGWVVGPPTSSTGRCCTAAPPSSTRASRWERLTWGRSGGWSPSTGSRRSSPRPRPSGRSGSRTPTASTSAATTSRACAPSSSPASGATRRRFAGRSGCSTCQ